MGRMVLTRIVYRDSEVVWIYKCEKCGYKLEVVKVRPRLPWDWLRKWIFGR